MNQFINVASQTELSDGEKKLIEVDDRLVILFRMSDAYYCLDDVCTHDGGTLSDGEHIGCEIACPRHGARFDVRTGAALCMPATQNTTVHEVKLEGGYVWVRLAES